MRRTIVLAPAIFIWSLVCGEVAYAQNVAPEAASQLSQEAPATEASAQSASQQQHTVAQSASDSQSTYQPPAQALPYQPVTGGSSDGNVPVTIQQAKIWQPDYSQIKSPDEIRATMAQRQQKFEAALNSWVGGDINELIMAWGAPSGVYKMPNQNAVFTWQSTGGIPAPEGGELMISCKISIFTDPHGRIFSWRWEGNGCV